MRRFLRNRAGVAGLVIIVFFIAATLLAPVLRPYDPTTDRDLRSRLLPPSAEHLFGTDELGRDVFTRVWHGGRVSLSVSVLVVAFSAVIGTALGLMAGLVGGRVDLFLSWFIDVLLAFPGILLAIAIVATLGASLSNALIAVSIMGIPGYYRVMRSSVIGLRDLEFVHAATALGASTFRLAWRHIFPNGLSPLIVQVTLALGRTVLSLAALGFLGLGAQPPTPEWGLMIKSGYSQFLAAPWLSIAPGFAIYLCVLGFNLLGDALRDHLDPQLRT
ncbi:MAG TPA: ABC transporter permease [Trueperaceae bacterium]|nr:ABC transporter permease [Trueperaceae bacterium]